MNEISKPLDLIRFGTFEVDLRARELRRQGRKIRLQDQPFQVLAILVEHPGEVVTREELQKELWPADTFVDFDHGLNKAITKIREALADSAESPRFIETLPRRGYRFAAPVDRLGSAVTPARDAPLAVSRGVARGLFLFAQAGYLLMYGFAFYYLPAIQRLSIILPGRDLSILVSVCALCGAALRLYFISAVAFDYPDSGRLFQRLFPGILLVDWAWSMSPVLLFHKLGEVILLFIAGLAFLPFSQRTLLFSAYARSGGRISGLN
jgi:cholera toxin transcriptional activator